MRKFNSLTLAAVIFAAATTVFMTGCTKTEVIVTSCQQQQHETCCQRHDGQHPIKPAAGFLARTGQLVFDALAHALI